MSAAINLIEFNAKEGTCVSTELPGLSGWMAIMMDRSLDCIVRLCLTLEETAKLSYKMTVLFRIPTHNE